MWSQTNFAYKKTPPQALCANSPLKGGANGWGQQCSPLSEAATVREKSHLLPCCHLLEVEHSKLCLAAPWGNELQCEDKPLSFSIRGARTENKYSRTGGEADLRRGQLRKSPRIGERKRNVRQTSLKFNRYPFSRFASDPRALRRGSQD